MISQRDNMAKKFGQVSIIWKKVASLRSMNSLFVCAFLALPLTAPKIAPKGRETSTPLIAGMAMCLVCLIDGETGNIIRIRMASKKQNFSNSPIDEHICSTSGRTDIPAQNKDGIGHKSKQAAIYILTKETSNFGQGFTAKAEKEELYSISKNDTGVPGITGTSSVHDADRSSIQKRESKCNKLFETWLPQKLEDICPDTDLDWLFSGNNQCNLAEKRLQSECNSMSCSSSSTLWQPHARILPEVDVLALPFTVPFA